MPPIHGFMDLANHFKRHIIERREFAFDTEAEYESAAIEFMNCPLDANTEERVRARDGATVRFNNVTCEIGVLHADGFIGTYFRLTRSNPRKYFVDTCL
ncbi:MAG: hypothetical protein V7641_5040 [Blastocatellia bacterium]